MWYPDLSTTCQIARGPSVRAVGWLSAEHEFTKGTVAVAALDALRVLVREGYCPVALAGLHTCELCSRERGSGNLLVPTGDLLYAAPAMIVHYVEAHEYAPPESFVQAVLACPAPPQAAYYDALRPFGAVWGYSDDDWNRLLDTEPPQIAELKRAHQEATKGKRFDWGDGHQTVSLPTN
jgi:hypothetical protein